VATPAEDDAGVSDALKAELRRYRPEFRMRRFALGAADELERVAAELDARALDDDNVEEPSVGDLLRRVEAALRAGLEAAESQDPGSPAAVERGCTCDVSENDFGRGRVAPNEDGTAFTVGWIVKPTCPLHGAVLEGE
jgi:hypothetical protein